MKIIQLLKSKLKERENFSIILDTSALETKDVMKIIEKADKVILLSGILEEMDKYKNDKSLFGKNIREVSRKSREDEKSQKYICVAGYEKYSYNDKNIISYCRLHKKNVIVTSDNNLCNYAKAYGVRYIYLERNKNEDQVPKVNKSKSKKNRKKQSAIIRQQIKNVQYKEGKLYLKTEKNSYKFFLYRNDVLENPTNGEIELKVGDIIFMIKNSSVGLNLTEYEIQVITENNYAFSKNKEIIESLKEYSLEEKHFPTEVKEYIIKIFNPKLKEVEEQKITLYESDEIHFYNNYIRVDDCIGFNTKTLLVREGKLININDYQEGDYLYVLRYNIRKKYVETKVYEIIFMNNYYKVQEVDKQITYYVNEVYKLNFSEEVLDVIWKIHINNSGY